MGKALPASGAARPRKANTATNSIRTRFNARLADADLDRLVPNPRSCQLVEVSGDKVSCKL